MAFQPPSQDDLLDVMEMSNKIEEHISEVLEGLNLNLAMSVLMSASINSLMSPCETLDEVLFYRNIYVQTLDDAILKMFFNRPKENS